MYDPIEWRKAIDTPPCERLQVKLRLTSHSNVGARISVTVALALVAIGPGKIFQVGPVWALPPGRAWAKTEELSAPGVLQFGVPRMDSDSAGRPLLIAAASTSATVDWSFSAWGDSGWQYPRFGRVRSGVIPEPVVSLIGGTHVVWVGVDPLAGWGHVLLSTFSGDSLAPPDTTLRKVGVGGSEYSAAVSDSRRWTAQVDGVVNQKIVWVRAAYSDTPQVWHEVEPHGRYEWTGCSLAPVSDSVALLAHAGDYGLWVARLEGARWTDSVLVDPRGNGRAIHPRFRLRPSGGLWLVWSDVLMLRVASNHSGTWVWTDSVTAAHPPGETFFSGWLNASQDGEERPILAWGDFGYGYTSRSVGCAAFPNDSGWDAGDEIPGSANQFTTPKVARDLNGDGWFAWDRLRLPGVFYTHTYVRATVGLPKVSGRTTGRTVSWTISEPAPKSWWAVLRAQGNGSLVPIARVQAGNTTQMTYVDATPATSSRLRYAIRRESVDQRYEWTGGSTLWWAEGRALTVRFPGGNPVMGGMVELAIAGAVQGGMDVRMYDLAGREVWQTQRTAGGTGEDTLTLRLSDAPTLLRPGLYLVRVTDDSGVSSAAAKVVVLR